MIAVNTYEEIEYNQRQNEDKQIIILLFVRPTAPDADKIIKEFGERQIVPHNLIILGSHI